MQVTDLGQVLHMVGGTAASYMIFFLPGMLLLNAAIVKRTASMADLEGAEVSHSSVHASELHDTTHLPGTGVAPVMAKLLISPFKVFHIV